MQFLFRRKARVLAVILLMAGCFLSGCAVIEDFCPAANASPAPTPAPDADAQDPAAPSLGDAEAPDLALPTYSVWIPYWDALSAVRELETLGTSVQNVIAFGAIFDEDGHPFLLDDMVSTLALLNTARCEQHTIYLSVINDVALSAGGYDNKTPKLLERLLKTHESTDAHIEALIQLVRSSGADGLEIDYEAIRDNASLWRHYTAFIEKLYARTCQEGIPLRVVLEYDSLKRSGLPEGPVYVVMCYNLFGKHSGAGPKADFEFLEDAFAYSRNLPGEVDMAFATGGFVWSGNSVTAISQVDAEAWLGEDPLACSRDEESGALHATRIDANGVTSELWYADAETLAIWRDRALDAGYRSISFFRLGGNVSEDLKRVFTEYAAVSDGPAID